MLKLVVKIVLYHTVNVLGFADTFLVKFWPTELTTEYAKVLTL